MAMAVTSGQHAKERWQQGNACLAAPCGRLKLTWSRERGLPFPWECTSARITPEPRWGSASDMKALRPADCSGTTPGLWG